jgi:hypothetical protein
MKMIKDHCIGIMTMNEKSTYVILESNIRGGYNGKRSLKHEVGKL